MKISGIHVDGFGLWRDRRWDGLTESLNVFHGPNEAGKTTLMSFIRSILFGFERRSHPRRYEPLNGGDYGGSIDVVQSGQKIRILRRGGRHVRGAVELRSLDSGTANIGEEGAEAERLLDELLGGTTRTLYHNVFAFGLEELEHFRTLEESEVASHISGAGMGVGAKRWSRVWRDLEDRRSQLYLPRGQNATLNLAFRDLESVRSEMDRTEEEPEDYLRALEAREQLLVEISGLEEEVRELEWRIQQYRKQREAEPYLRRRKELEAELAGMEDIRRFPEGGVDRLNLLFDQRRELETGIGRCRDEMAAFQSERQALLGEYAPQDLIRRSRAVESLRLLLPRRDASEQVVASAMARRDAEAQERERLEGRRRSVGPPSHPAMGVLVGLVGSAVLGLVYAGYPEAVWLAPVLLVAIGGWYYSRTRAAGGVSAEIVRSEVRLAEAQAALDRSIGEGREIAASIGKLVGRSDFSYVDLETEAARLGELAEKAERLRTVEAQWDSADHQITRLREQIDEAEGKIRKLLEEGGAESESEFFRRSEVFRRRQELDAELQRIPAVQVPNSAGEAQALDASTFQEAVGRRDRSVARLREARTEVGRLEERLATLSMSEQRSRARLRQESVKARIDEASEKWAVLTLCRALLADTRQVYETERQPEVLRHASDFFGRMTGGRWVRVISPLEAGVLVESASGDRVSPEQLSRGTGEQLYLAMRLALVREFSRHAPPLPVMLDDIFVNFDPERARRSIEAVGELSSTHQVLLFTCHPHLVQMVEEIVPAAQRYPLQ